MSTDTDNDLSLESQLCFSLYAAQLAVGRTYRRLLNELALTYPQYLVMLVLWERDGQGVSRIGELLHLNSATLTPLLKRLETAGLLVRQRSSTDERQVTVTLTEEGSALQQRAACIPAQAFDASQCSPEELASLKASLDQLRHNLDQ
ncbi:MarR family winged helix-turn-helix transcriptional regulator [Larsenimonas rhizosphaerae]|uniref:MarR family transcriptional regulator n=1 Tax=Larsenimonas rhizosphaerae TaxID=2944682 RepID=A0AA42CYP9_9GAMM|nr:MarR family transcriptional regulator [Larsenimonas rhizosphaerae]MCX2525395.1 MarR family transcriptional regulator [Larsenimonas rhizosphaerae]